MAKLREQKFYQYTNIVHEKDAEDFASGRYLPVERLTGILKALVQAIQKPDINSKTRGHLYGALLNYLHFTKRPVQYMMIGMSDVQKESILMKYMDKIENQWKDLKNTNQHYLHTVGGENLIKTIVNDTTLLSSSVLWTIAMSFSILDALINLDSKGKWITYLNQQGLLRDWLNDIARQEEFEDMVTADGVGENNPFIIESKLSMFIRIAETKRGANILIDNGVISIFTNCEFMKQTRSLSTEPIQLLVISLMYRLLITGSSNTTASMVMYFFEKHKHYLKQLIQKASNKMPLRITLSILKQQELITGIFYRLALNQHELPSSMAKRCILSLINKYSVPENYMNHLCPVTRQEKKNDERIPPFSKYSIFKCDALHFVYSILRNAIGFSRCISLPFSCKNDKTNKNILQNCQILFTPTFISNAPATNSGGRGEGPSIGTVTGIVVWAYEVLNETLVEDKLVVETLKNISGIHLKKLQEVLQCEWSSISEEWDSPQIQKFSHWVLSRVHLQKSCLTQNFYNIIENLLLLIYCHLSSYLHPKNQSPPNELSSTSKEIREGTVALLESHVLDNLLKLPHESEPNLINTLVNKLKILLISNVNKQ